MFIVAYNIVIKEKDSKRFIPGISFTSDKFEKEEDYYPNLIKAVTKNYNLLNLDNPNIEYCQKFFIYESENDFRHKMTFLANFEISEIISNRSFNGKGYYLTPYIIDTFADFVNHY